MRVPLSAEPILKERKRGFRPADLVIVSLVGLVRAANPVVYVNGPDYDWLFLKGLEVCVFADDTSKWKATLTAIMAQEPAKTSLWDVNRQEGCHCFYLPTLRAVERGIPPFERELSFIEWNSTQNMEFACN